MENLPIINSLSRFKTDKEVIQSLPKPKKGSADVIGIRLLGIDPNQVDKTLQDYLTWTPKGCFTKRKDVAKQLIDYYDAVYIEDNNIC